MQFESKFCSHFSQKAALKIANARSWKIFISIMKHKQVQNRLKYSGFLIQQNFFDGNICLHIQFHGRNCVLVC